MTRDEFNAFCSTLPGAKHYHEWGDASVWKVEQTIFALCAPWNQGRDQINFKCDPMVFDVLQHTPGYQPSEKLGRNRWIRVSEQDYPGREDIKDYLRYAYSAVVEMLTAQQRRDLGLATPKMDRPKIG